MIIRLTLVTTLLALFAISFAGLVEGTRPSHASLPQEDSTCLERGLVCAAR